MIGHILKTDIGLGAVSSLLVLVADISWLVHDIAHNGLSLTYSLISLGLLLGWLGIAYSLVLHHRLIACHHKRNLYHGEDGRNGD